MQETCFQWRAWKAEAGALSGRAIGSRTHKTACRLGILLAVAVMAIPSSAREAAIVQGRQIATQGTATGVAPCASCHGARGEGAAAFPRLAGTGQSYLRAQLDAFAEGSRKNPVMQPFARAGQLQAWKAGTRPPGPLALMQGIAQRLSNADITAVSSYYAGLAPASARSAASAAKEVRP